MVKRALIRLGDKTTHGGVVLEGDLTLIVEGKPVARVGDKVHCPRCKGAFPIISGAMDVWSGQAVARHDDVTGCGAKLIASQNDSTWGDDGGGEESMGAASEEQHATPSGQAKDAVSDQPEPKENSDDDDDQPRAIRFQSIKADTGEPSPKCVYILTREDGTKHGGITDAQGFTEVIETNSSEKIAVHFMFKSPNDHTIERENLV